MKTISVAISEKEYKEFQRIAKETDRSVAQLIRAAMAHYRTTVLEQRGRLTELKLLHGARPIAPLPTREALYDEVFDPGALGTDSAR